MLSLILVAAISAAPDKSLDPTGKPWTAGALCDYIAPRMRDKKFTLAHKLELEIGVGKRKRSFVVSETKARTQFLKLIERQYKLDEPPRQGIAVFSGREKFLAELEPDSKFDAYLKQNPARLESDNLGQAFYWVWAVELLDFRENYKAARAYSDGFRKIPGCEDLECVRWYSITLTGNVTAVRQINSVLLAYPGYSHDDASDSN